MGEIGKGSFADLFPLAPCFAQQDGRRRVTIRDTFDKHGNIYIIYSLNCKDKYYIYMDTN
jgi:hypothetical protein